MGICQAGDVAEAVFFFSINHRTIRYNIGTDYISFEEYSGSNVRSTEEYI